MRYISQTKPSLKVLISITSFKPLDFLLINKQTTIIIIKMQNFVPALGKLMLNFFLVHHSLH